MITALSVEWTLSEYGTGALLANTGALYLEDCNVPANNAGDARRKVAISIVGHSNQSWSWLSLIDDSGFGRRQSAFNR
ncbi:hypothetical protein ASD99_16730 [Mesorhizobium sp. Root695]|jgi:hypothetical protein|uniref:hypothetical protein n=1 Tax=unclassified Mesorhizobium TaxID=325217 RepID=UPI0006FF5264|nr:MULTISPECIES: hypothetical protein [unclassified Mesorhizobium]KQU83324.1 hypothetical protein ASD12_09830 [Mesorhizobium sp. Root102]KRB33479.1 hypothetical protein ASD99_16730 [Mesorhizobium sp. Root695]